MTLFCIILLFLVAVGVVLVFRRQISNQISIQYHSSALNHSILQGCFTQFKSATEKEGQQKSLSKQLVSITLYQPIKYLLSFWICQMILNHGLRKLSCYCKSLHYERELIFSPTDGGNFSLEWYPRKPNQQLDSNKESISVVVILHGITVVMTRRSCGDLVLSSPYLANDPSETADLELACREIKKRLDSLPSKKIIHGIGFSFGGILLSRYLTHIKDPILHFQSIMLISVPCCIFRMENIARQQSWIVKKAATMTLQHNFLKKKNISWLKKNSDFSEQKAWKANSTEKWNEDVTFTTQLKRYSSLQHFYQESSAKNWIHEISCPCLVVNASDDPLCTIDVVSELGHKSANPHLIFVQTQYGGHCTFSDHYNFTKASWLEELAANFISQTAK